VGVCITTLKNHSLALLLLLFMSLLNSCVAQSGGGKKNSTTSEAATTDTSIPEAPTFSDDQDLYWHNISATTDKTLILNENNSQLQYLKGSTIDTFLRSSTNGTTYNYNNTYCLVASYNSTLTKKNLRIRAVPVPIRTLTAATVKVEYVLRLDFAVDSVSQSSCDGAALQITTTPDAATSVSTIDTAFTLPDLCPTCSGILTSTDVSLYNSASPITIFDRLAESTISLGNIVLRINTQSSSPVDNPSCSDSACSAKGFNCCIDGQCVNDKQIRPNATLQSTYSTAMNDFNRDPATFINWPNIFFVCGETPSDDDDDDDDTGPENPDLDAEERVAELKAKYDCLIEGRKDTPDFTTTNVCEPTYDQTAFESIRAEVWKDCGCQATPFPTDPDDPSCPDYYLALDYSDSNVITGARCVFDSTVDDKPFQDLSISVSSRSSPRRFYRADTGASVDDMTSLDSTVTVEGDSFQYADNNSKTEPSCGTTSSTCSFNMNSITGQFNVDLTQARPATVVQLDYDQTYIINTASGSYTPCLECDKDAWFNSFSAFPRSDYGAGVVGKSYTTNRSSYSSNQSYGNYEDTIFGRACFLPPTMIPYGHKPDTTLADQRQSRLATQAAFFVNGYQRDWYGFNAGALIGSFDGSSWFSIGSGNRRIRSKSTKLFLAINAPYADLAAQSSFVVQVFEDNTGSSLAPTFDYDPAATVANTGASCQRWHQCETDTDCITTLGWEYQCNDINQFKTSWPRFDSDANEKALDEYSKANFSRLLTAGIAPGSRKRCVYRGAGALCKQNYSTLSPDSRKKIMTCAPNFHCASLDSSSFNQEIVRTTRTLSSVQYGQEADVLGRPLYYIDAGQTLPTTIKDQIRHSAQYYSTDTTDYGLCRPGKRIVETTHLAQHSAPDTGHRADYINQVGVCDSAATGTTRTVACPQIQMTDGATTSKGDIILSVDADEQLAQNSCGGEASYMNGALAQNTFASIEKSAIQFINSLASPSLAADACKRRPGQVCHSDLDCSPNRLHAQVALSLGVGYFGGTVAEKEYWTQSLVCGQATPKPSLTADNYDDYDMSLNRCCREVGSDFTMYTEGDSDTADDNPNLSVSTYPHDDPQVAGRYSRYASSQAIDGTPNPVTTTAPYAQAPIVDQASGVMPKAFQWKTLNDTGSNNCCGGGWVRKFADGTNSWSNSTRLNIQVENLACLNYQTENYESAIDGVDQSNWEKSYEAFCLSPLDGGCIQQEFSETSGDLLATPPTLSAKTTATLDTTPANPPNPTSGESNVTGMEGLSIDVPYEPVIYANTTAINTLDGNFYSYFKSKSTYPGVSFYLPAYIGYDPGTAINNIVGAITYVYYNQDGTQVLTTTPALNGVCSVTTSPTADLATDEYCIESRDGHYIFHGHADTVNGTDWDHAAVQITFNVQNGTTYLYAGSVTDSSRLATSAGSEVYYLTKLARFELLGIPQIVYEPLFCSTNRDQLVDGLFDLSAPTRENFYNNSHVMDAGNVAVNGRPLLAMYNENITLPNTAQSSAYDSDGNGVADIVDPTHLWDPAPVVVPYTYTEAQERFVFSDKVELNPVFSSSDFKCCTKLGGTVTTSSKCCSGFMDSENTCKLPAKANLNIYFNKFVSSEGIDEDLPDGGLTDTDFIPETGEPKLNSSVTSKIEKIGKLHCANGSVRRGGAFGYFVPQPNNGVFVSREDVDQADEKVRKYSIVDSVNDNDTTNQSGYQDFTRGFRWDHHIYCE
jgi:hypothetical protein